MAKKRKKKDKRNQRAMMRQKRAIQRKARRTRKEEGKFTEVELPLTAPDESAERAVWQAFWKRFHNASWESKIAVCLEIIGENKMNGDLAFDMLQRHASVANYLSRGVEAG